MPTTVAYVLIPPADRIKMLLSSACCAVGNILVCQPFCKWSTLSQRREATGIRILLVLLSVCACIWVFNRSLSRYENLGVMVLLKASMMTSINVSSDHSSSKTLNTFVSKRSITNSFTTQSIVTARSMVIRLNNTVLVSKRDCLRILKSQKNWQFLPDRST